MNENLWPDFELAEPLTSPKSIIDASGVGLEKKTNGVVRFIRTNVNVTKNTVELSYDLYAPSLVYFFPFMRAIFPVDRFYPVRLVADQLSEMVAANENELNRFLAEIFNAPSTIATIQRLISLAK